MDDGLVSPQKSVPSLSPCPCLVCFSSIVHTDSAVTYGDALEKCGPTTSNSCVSFTHTLGDSTGLLVEPPQPVLTWPLLSSLLLMASSPAEPLPPQYRVVLDLLSCMSEDQRVQGSVRLSVLSIVWSTPSSLFISAFL